MDIFEKCYAPSLATELREKGVYPYFHALESRQDVEVIMEGKRRIMLGSNNYLGLTTDPAVVEAGIKALEKYGTGCVCVNCLELSENDISEILKSALCEFPLSDLGTELLRFPRLVRRC